MMTDSSRQRRILCGTLGLSAVVLALGLSACGGQNAPLNKDAAVARALSFPVADTVVIHVNGEAVSEALLIRVAKARGLDLSDPEQRQQAMDLLVETVLLAQDAIENGLIERADIQADLDLVRIQTLASRNLADTRAGMELSDEQLREFYQQVIAQTGTIELNLLNVMYADEASASAGNAAALASGDFPTWMATAEATGAQQAADIGWANVAQLPPELARAAIELADGDISPAPVRSAFGWHVFQRAGSRNFTPPPFEDVRDGIRKQAGDKHLEEKLAGLRTKASIEPVASTP